ncbi:MAG: hypothetical protein ACLU93_05070 [Streptococcus sp.]
MIKTLVLLVTDSFVHVYNWNYRNLDGDHLPLLIAIPGNDLVIRMDSTQEKAKI